MKKDLLVYWATTLVIVLLMFASAVNFAFNPSQKEAFSHLGLPTWFRLELTVAKFLGSIVLVWPRLPKRLKEFAYFGFGLTIVSADVAHLSSGDPWWFVIPHVTFLAILAVSFQRFERLRAAGLV